MSRCYVGLATKVLNLQEMGRGVSSGGGQSSLGYLFGSGETANNVQGAANSQGQPENGGRTQNASVASPPIDKQVPVNGGRTQNATTSPIDKQIPAGIPGCLKNNYHRADGQNCGNFLTVWTLVNFSFSFELYCVISFPWYFSVCYTQGSKTFDFLHKKWFGSVLVKRTEN